MILPKDNVFGIVQPTNTETPTVKTANADQFMQSALDVIVSRYENQYAKKAVAKAKLMEQQKLNDEVTNTFNATIKYYRDRIESMNAMNFHRRQVKKKYDGVHNLSGVIMKNESFFTDELLFIKVLFNTNWGDYHFVPPNLQADRAQGTWEGNPPAQLLIDAPPPVTLLGAVYTYLSSVDGKVRLCQMPNPLYGYEPDALPRQLYLYVFYSKPREVL
jgi:hypothetical protein